MPDLALHILDLIENSIRAGASVISLTFEENIQKDVLIITVENNSPGPVLTTDEPVKNFSEANKSGNRMEHNGLCLFRADAEQAGGNLEVDESELGGTLIRVTMRLSHIDRCPFGDLAAALSSIVCTNPFLDVWLRFRAGDQEYAMRVEEVVRELRLGGLSGLTVARRVREKIKTALTSLKIEP